MNIIKTAIPEVLVLEPEPFYDERGFFFESYNRRQLEEVIPEEFVQDNHSRSAKQTLRGLHYQIKFTQGKLVRVTVGEIFDVAVDLRKSSKSYGKWVGEALSADNRRQLWIPPGFAHGFLVISDSAEVLYKTTSYYSPEDQRCIIWNDPDLNISWPCKHPPLLSQKDRNGSFLRHAEVFE